MSAAVDPTEFHPDVDTFLQGLREWMPGSYRASRMPDTWDAHCPVCNSFFYERHTLHITENSRGAMVRCDSHCEPSAIFAALGLTAAPDPVPAPDSTALRILTIADLEQLPEPEFLLDSVLPAAGFTVLFGPSGSGKSFLALDWAMCVASGVSWFGRTAKAGPVLFIAAEGAHGLYRRVTAWCEERNQTPPERLLFLPDAVNFLEPAQVARATTAIAALPEPPVLIVVDTLARCMVGGDENAARDVGLFIAAVDKLRATIRAGALVVHHTGKNGDDERGSSALRGAADMSHGLKLDGTGIVLECRKAKDSEENQPLRLHLAPVAKSCVIRSGTNSGRIAPAETAILEAVSASFGTGWASPTAIRDASEVPKSSLYRALESLHQRGFLAKDDEGKAKRYKLTPDGLAAAVPTSPNQSHGTGQTVPSQPSPLRKGGTTGPAWDDKHLQALIDEEAVG